MEITKRIASDGHEVYIEKVSSFSMLFKGCSSYYNLVVEEKNPSAIKKIFGKHRKKYFIERDIICPPLVCLGYLGNCCGSPEIKTAEIEMNKLVLEGNCAQVFYKKDSNGESFPQSKRFEIPANFKKKLEVLIKTEK